MKLFNSRCFFTLATGLGLITFAFFLILIRDGRLDLQKETNLDFVSSLEREQIRRLKRIKNSCDKEPSLNDPHPYKLEHFIIDDKNKLIYCFVPKVACTNWKRVILSLRNQAVGNPLNIKGNESHLPELFQTLNQLQSEEIGAKLKTYLKFIFVRHPYERLLSAYRNKFENTYSNYFQIRFGRKIIKQYRVNASAESLLRGHDVTFQEFIQYVTDLNVTNEASNFNEHWRPIKFLCYPCNVKFDIIGKYETLVNDAEYTLLRAGLSNKVSFPRRDQTYKFRPTTDLLHEYYDKIDQNLIQKLALIYKEDLEMFHYSETIT